MPKFRYKAINEGGGIHSGSLIAFNEEDLENRLQREDLTLVSCKRIKEFSLLLGGPAKRVKPGLLIEFYHRFSQTLSIGLPVLTGLDENAKAMPSKGFQKIIQELRVALEDGRSLHESMKRFPQVFHKLDIGIVRIGEQTGSLPTGLEDLAGFLEWKEEIRSTIKRATIYPAFIFLVIGAVTGVWVGYVLPQMAGVLQDIGVDLPRFTRIILGLSLFLKANWFFILGAVVALFIGLFLLQKTRRGGLLFHRFLLKVPLVGNIASNIVYARFSQNFSTMFRAGMNINHIFELLTENLLGNRYMEYQLARVYDEVKAGSSLAEGFAKIGDFPPLLMGSIRHGELTGTLDEAFKRVGGVYDRDAKRTVHALISAFEPITLIVLGGIFGLIILSILLPLYDVISQVGKAY